MATGWVLIDDDHYYCDSTGKMVTDKWIDDYYLLENGRMVRNQCIRESCVDENGKKDKPITRKLASNLDIEGLSLGSYEFINSYKGLKGFILT